VVSSLAPRVTDADPAETESVGTPAAAWEGATESIPSPKAAIAERAIRLKNVFFDITFLSCVANETFSSAAGKEEIFAA